MLPNGSVAANARPERAVSCWSGSWTMDSTAKFTVSAGNRKPSSDMEASARDTVTVGEREVDYVLVYTADDDVRRLREEVQLGRHYRLLFEKAMRDEGLLLEEEYIGSYAFVKVHCPFERLCQEAEAVRLDLPLDGLIIEGNQEEEDQQWIHEKVAKIFDMGVDSRTISAPFQCRCREWFIGLAEKETFFRSALRCLLTHHVLINIDITKGDVTDATVFHKKKGLAYLLMKRVYHDAFVMHDRSSLEPVYVPSESLPTVQRSVSALKVTDAGLSYSQDSSATPKRSIPDHRRLLDRRWRKLMSGQPLNKIRDCLHRTWGLLLRSH